MGVQFISGTEAAEMITDGSMVSTGGFVGIGVPEEIHKKIEERYKKTGHPNNLGLMYSAGQGDGCDKGLNHLGHDGLVTKVIGGHWGLVPKLGKLANENKLIGYNIPQGVISHLFRDIAAGKPGTLSHVGLGTFVDPDLEGGKINCATTEEIVHKIKINGEDILFYDGQKIDFAILRGTSADDNGNISFEKESLTLENLSLAMAAKNSGGKVIVQVERKTKASSIDPKLVKIPGIFVDAVVVAEDMNNHMQTFSEQFNENYITNRIEDDFEIDFELNERKIIARRSAMLLNSDTKIINYGIGMPEGISIVLKEEKINHKFIPTVEPGAIGGTPAGGLSFGCSSFPEAIIDQPYQFDFYDGGGLDMAFLGLAQCDVKGNINVSKFGSKIAGCGGFIDISQNAKEIVFCGTFTAGGLKTKLKNGKLLILKEGKVKKFVKNVEQITFSGELAVNANKTVLYITERAVFELTVNGLLLTEIAPGIDIKNHIFKNMDFIPEVSNNLKFMDIRIFKNSLMNLSEDYLTN
ncbi:MAG TPA: acyl CoA:acetate/3-ketoacid CoA transferase [Victivallales bacterium]|nr:acyl CoA:acetate/3-ketoacid CoA transferase [Victivallales bacterium]